MTLNVLKVPMSVIARSRTGDKKDEGARLQEAPSPSVPGIQVWDPVVRLFHWGVIASFAIAFITADEIARIHETAGYTVLGLLVVRIVWGFIGTRHARFSDFLPTPGKLLAYLRNLVKGRAPRHIGHNPAGALMIFILLGLLGVICASGWAMLTPAFFGVEWIEEVHEAAAWGILALLPLHIGGALLSSIMHRENLIWSMVTGRKRLGTSMSDAARTRVIHENLSDRMKALKNFMALLLVAGMGGGFWLLTAPTGRDSKSAITSAAVAMPSGVTPAARTPGRDRQTALKMPASPTQRAEKQKTQALAQKAPAQSTQIQKAGASITLPRKTQVRLTAFNRIIRFEGDGEDRRVQLARLLCRDMISLGARSATQVLSLLFVLHPAVIRELQHIMLHGDLYEGDVDGVAGRATRAALRQLAHQRNPSICKTHE